MKTIDLLPYPIVMGSGVLQNITDYFAPFKNKKAALISDSNVAPLYMETLRKQLLSQSVDVTTVCITPGESSKDLETLQNIVSLLVSKGFCRDDLIVALGGGVVGDLSGFIAACYLRGISYIQMPTSLLAQVDSAIGGKVAINTPQGKNLLGFFYDPLAVLSDLDVLDTLDRRHLAAGMAEVIKCAAIRKSELWPLLRQIKGLDDVLANRQQVVELCCDVKISLVKEDPLDQGIRHLLNFGHTLGHALEAAGYYCDLLHGEAVALGMLAAARMGVSLGISEANTAKELLNMLQKFELPTSYDRNIYQSDTLQSLIIKDKKNSNEWMKLVLLKDIGDAAVYNFAKDEWHILTEAL